MTLFYEKLFKRAMIDIDGLLVYKEDRFSLVPFQKTQQSTTYLA